MSNRQFFLAAIALAAIAIWLAENLWRDFRVEEKTPPYNLELDGPPPE